ncbi:TPA: hypothetical protein ACNUZJ_003466 [Raoultella ornithinolytica]
MARILFVSSGGGHWVQLTRIVQELNVAHDEVYMASTIKDSLFLNQPVYNIPDFNKSKPLSTVVGSFIIFFFILKIRPKLAISTGAAPGLLCLFFTRVLGGKSIWIDSIANTEHLSLSGRIAKFFCNKSLTQWEHLADGKRIDYQGRII